MLARPMYECIPEESAIAPLCAACTLHALDTWCASNRIESSFKDLTE